MTLTIVQLLSYDITHFILLSTNYKSKAFYLKIFRTARTEHNDLVFNFNSVSKEHLKKYAYICFLFKQKIWSLLFYMDKLLGDCWIRLLESWFLSVAI